MKIKTILLIFAFATFFSNHSSSQSKGIKARLIICSGLSDKNIPLDNLNEINIKEGDKVYFYTKWFNLSKRSYIASIDFLDADDNYLVQSSEHKFKPRKRTHNTWNSRKFREIIIPEGIVKIRIILDGQTILERRISVKYIHE